jgi:hypothetical protein
MTSTAKTISCSTQTTDTSRVQSVSQCDRCDVQNKIIQARRSMSLQYLWKSDMPAIASPRLPWGLSSKTRAVAFMPSVSSSSAQPSARWIFPCWSRDKTPASARRRLRPSRLVATFTATMVSLSMSWPRQTCICSACSHQCAANLQLTQCTDNCACKSSVRYARDAFDTKSCYNRQGRG